jgi:hypothetical protein
MMAVSLLRLILQFKLMMADRLRRVGRGYYQTEVRLLKDIIDCVYAFVSF